MGLEQLLPAIAGMTWQSLVMIGVGLTLIYHRSGHAFSVHSSEECSLSVLFSYIGTPHQLVAKCFIEGMTNPFHHTQRIISFSYLNTH